MHYPKQLRLNLS